MYRIRMGVDKIYFPQDSQTLEEARVEAQHNKVRKSNAFIFEKAAAAGSASIRRTTPIANDIALSVNLASHQQTADFLASTGPGSKLWDHVRELIDRRKSFQKMLREFLKEKLEE